MSSILRALLRKPSDRVRFSTVGCSLITGRKTKKMSAPGRLASGQERSGQKWDHDLMMSDEVESFALASQGPLNDVLSRTIMMDKIKNSSRKIVEPLAFVPDVGDGLEKNLGQDDGRADIDEDSGLEPFH